jgi:hypothetical protein
MITIVSMILFLKISDVVLLEILVLQLPFGLGYYDLLLDKLERTVQHSIAIKFSDYLHENRKFPLEESFFHKTKSIQIKDFFPDLRTAVDIAIVTKGFLTIFGYLY